MKKASPVFHAKYFRETFLRLKTAGIVSAAILLFMVLINALTAFGSFFSLVSGGSNTTLTLFIGNAHTYILIAGMLLTFIAFEWMNRRSSCDVYFALPMTRTQMYCSSILAVILWLAIGIAASSAVFALFGGGRINLLFFALIIISLLLAVLIVVGVTAIAASLTGIRFAGIVTALVILYVPYMLFTLFDLLVVIEANGMIPFGDTLGILTDGSYNIVAGGASILPLSPSGEGYADGWALLYNFAWGLVFLGLGLLLFNRRNAEAAGMPMTSKWVHIAVRCCIGLPPLLILAFIEALTRETLAGISVTFIGFSFITYCLYELITVKKFKKMLTALPWYGICIAVFIAFCALPAKVADAELDRDTSADNIKGYSIQAAADESTSLILPIAELAGLNFGTYVDTYVPVITDLTDSCNTYTDAYIKEVLFTSDEGIRILSDAIERNKTGNDGSIDVVSVFVRIRRETGRTIERIVSLTQQDVDRLAEIWGNDTNYMEAAARIPPMPDVQSDDEDFTEIVEFMLDELNDMPLEQRYAAVVNCLNFYSFYPAQDHAVTSVSDLKGYYDMLCYGGQCGVEIATFTIRGSDGYRSYSFSLKIKPEFLPKTAQRYMEWCNSHSSELDHQLLLISNACKGLASEAECPFMLKIGFVNENGERVDMRYTVEKLLYTYSYISYHEYGPQDGNINSAHPFSDDVMVELIERLSSSPLSTDPNSYVMVYTGTMPPAFFALSGEDMEWLLDQLKGLEVIAS